MAAPLRIVWPAAPDAPAETPECRVFDAETVMRLVLVNNATRALREMGYRVTGQCLYPRYDLPPHVSIQRDPQVSLAPLLDASGEHRWVKSGPQKLGRVTYRGVTVTWVES
ncbi:MAG: hypothetical protein LBI59_11495 [Candidatus Accumulibacter sp.]|jgi:hypothetical protein|nr:hypothetical protein [Accumulibacter sp.]